MLFTGPDPQPLSGCVDDTQGTRASPELSAPPLSLRADDRDQSEVALMGMKNRQRRAAKRRERERRSKRGNAWAFRPAGPHSHQHRAGVDERALAAATVLQALADIEADGSAATAYARLLTGPESPVALQAVAETVDGMLSRLLPAVLRGGWAPSDLGEIVRRRLTTRHVPALVALLAAQADQHPPNRVATAWREELSALGPAAAMDLRTTSGLELALGMCALLTTLPQIAEIIPPPGAAFSSSQPAAGTDAKVLARVRSLLAKAESTEFSEEAEALSAKAQELISRYALDRLMNDAGREHPDGQVVSRRLWIDPPYVFPKALLIDEVASANRCQSVVTEHIGFSTVVGAPSDLDAVELLVTSLLVQANTAMLRCGSHADRYGNSRTTSFRRSFLIAYATRIGERLRAATQEAAESAGRTGELVRMLQRHAEQVDALREELFPNLVQREASISNRLGWAAGRAAADLALLDTDLQVSAQTG